MNLLKNLHKIPFIKSVLVVFAGSFSLNILNYLYNLLMVRLLPKEDYGTLMSIVSLLTILTIFGGTINLIVTKFSASINAEKSQDQVFYFIRNLTRKIIPIGLAMFIGFITFIPFFTQYLNLANSFPLWIMSIALIYTFVTIIPLSTLQGLQRFKAFSFVSAFTGVSKLLIATTAVLLLTPSYKIGGAILGVVASTVLGYYLASFFLRDLKHTTAKSNPIEWAPLLKFALPSLITFSGITFLANIDVVLAKNLLTNPIDASYYAGLSTMGKAIFYATGVIPLVLYPMVSSKHAKRESSQKILFFSSVAIILCGCLAFLGYQFFPVFFINLLLGAKYSNIAPFMGLFAIIMTLYSLIATIVNYYLSLNKYKIIGAPLLSSLLLYLGLQFFVKEASLETVIQIVFWNMTGLFGIICIYILWEERVYIKEVFIKYFIHKERFTVKIEG
jgi:O-antigen/teichoic acid export membrane protein